MVRIDNNEEGNHVVGTIGVGDLDDRACKCADEWVCWGCDLDIVVSVIRVNKFSVPARIDVLLIKFDLDFVIRFPLALHHVGNEVTYLGEHNFLALI